MYHRINLVSIAAFASVIWILSGCGSTGVPVMPDYDGLKAQTQSGSHVCLGLWQFTIDPARNTLDTVPLRSSQTHMNALAFMEPPAGVLLKVDQVVSVVPGEITVDIALTHPYPGANFSAAFDVCGILIGHGEHLFPLSDDLLFAGEDQVRLLNADGYTRWWNPVEFPPNVSKPSEGYIDGLLGTPQATANFSATLNGYKYFASSLTSPGSDLNELDKSMRGAFLPGTKCVRRYRIAFAPGSLVFNYAVDANWAPPIGPKPIDIPDDFPPSANRPEPYRIEIHNMINTLTYDADTSTASGDLSMSVWVYDWFEPGGNTVCAYSQNSELTDVCTPFPVPGGDTYSVYKIDLWPSLMTSSDDVLLWFDIECKTTGYQGAIPGKRQSAFFQQIIPVAEG